ncbi:hypothetical protein [Dyadobacter sp.]|jgi:hypothetical protein|uniref:hypothetical protein n=1 Tax=Dyadobacter sp. TaxID=1914288 RepID=UPI003F709CBF
MFIDNPDYQQHPIFEDLGKYFNFYKDLSFGVSHFISIGTIAMGNIDTQIFAAMGGTMDSMRALLLIGRINDAYSLLRKFYDTAIINVYSTLYLSDHLSTENFIVTQINDWLEGKRKLPEYKEMSNYIGNHTRLKTFEGFFYKNDFYKRLRSRCNDQVHYNLYKYLLYNNNEVYLPQRLNQLNQLKADVKNVIIMHLAYLFLLNPHYLASSDYADYLELNITPPDGIENEVAPFIQNIFDDVVKKHRPDIAKIILASTPMNLI